MTLIFVLSLTASVLLLSPATPAAAGPGTLPTCLGGWIIGTRLYDGDREVTAVCASKPSQSVRLTSLPGRDLRAALNPSGTTLAFAHADGDAWTTWFLDMRTGALSQMPKVHASELPNDWKDDDTLVYGASQSGIYCSDTWTYVRSTGERRPITDEGKTRCESHGSGLWSPARSRYYYVGEFSQEIKMRSESGAPLPSSPAFPECGVYPHLGWAKASSRAVLAVYCFGPNELRFLDADTFETRYPSLRSSASYAWSPSGRAILVDLAGDGAHSIIDVRTGHVWGVVHIDSDVSWWGYPLFSRAHHAIEDACSSGNLCLT